MSQRCTHDHRNHDHAHHTTHAALENSGVGDHAVSGDRTAIRILQMDCPTEETLIRNKLKGMSDVLSMDFNLMRRVLTVVHTPNSLGVILEALHSLGFEGEVSEKDGKLPTAVTPSSKPWWPLALAGVCAIAAEALHWAGQPELLSAGLAIAAILLSGLTTYKKGWIAVRNGNLNINALMSIAVTGAILLGLWAEAAMVMVLFTIAELIEAKSLDRARNAIATLMNLVPQKATVLSDDGLWKEVQATAVTLGMIVRVKPGERIALDGEIIAGSSTVDQAPITGESLPVDKKKGDGVFAGTINQTGSFDFRATATADNTTLARIVHAVEQAQGAKAPTQRFVDRFARIYTPVVIAGALALAIVPPLFMAAAWSDWLYKSLVLLVIACPCALVISTPVTIVSGLAAAARHGILVKGGVFLELGRKLSCVVLDKTGTITQGKPVRTDLERLGSMSDERCMEIASGLAQRSDHPVSMAIAASAVPASNPAPEVTEFQALPGRGVSGIIEGVVYHLGSHRMVKELGRSSVELELKLDVLEKQGKSVVFLLNDTAVLALFGVADTIKSSSPAAIAELHDMGIKTVILSGDNHHTAQAIARQVGVENVRGGQLPADKQNSVQELAANATVGMVGDGINDAPALAQADIGFVMGAMGTDTAIETADVALMDDDLRKISSFIRLSRATHAILVQNIVLALGIKLVFLILAIGGVATMWMAVFADVGASLLVVANGLRLLRKSY